MKNTSTHKSQHQRLIEFKILLPLFFNSGEPIPSSLFDETYQELTNRFGGISIEHNTSADSINGFWKLEPTSKVFSDYLQRIIVDTQDTKATHKWFHQFRTTLENRFQQEQVWITSQSATIE